MLFLRSFPALTLLAALLASAAGVRAQSPSVPPSGEQTPKTGSTVPQAPVAGAPIPPAPPATEPAEDPQGDAVTMFPHSESSRWWISGQANFILQWHASFPAKYSGVNSLHPFAENATSRVLTLATGLALTHSTELVVQIETAGGHGLSEAFGLAGFTNLDVVRNPTLGSKPYWARILLRQIIPLGQTRSRGTWGAGAGHNSARAAARDSPRQIHSPGFLRPQLGGQRQPFAILKLGRGQQRGL